MTMYKQADGTFTANKSAIVLAGNAESGQEAAMAIAVAWWRVEREIPTSWAVGCALHEGNYAVNIRNVESNGHTTGGVFELDLPSGPPYLNAGDAAATGMLEKSPFDLDDACAILAVLLRRYKVLIIRAANKWNAANGLPAIDPTAPPSDVYSYMAIGHNQGIGAALKSINTYGMNWAAYKARPENAGVNVAIDRGSGIYGDDVVSGGVDFSEAMLAPFDAAGAVIPPPVIDAFWESNLRVAVLLVMLGLIVYFFAVVKTPLKGTL